MTTIAIYFSTMISPDDITQILLTIRPELERLGVKGLWIFGSAARGEAEAKDIDFLVEFEQAATFTGFMNLKFLLEKTFDKPVDLLTRNSCPERFMRRIQSDLLHVA